MRRDARGDVRKGDLAVEQATNHFGRMVKPHAASRRHSRSSITSDRRCAWHSPSFVKKAGDGGYVSEHSQLSSGRENDVHPGMVFGGDDPPASLSEGRCPVVLNFYN